MDTDLEALGTNAHELPMVYAALADSDEDLAKRAEVTAADLAAVKAGQVLVPILRRVARHLRLSADALEALANKAWYPAQPNFPRGFAMFNTPFEAMTAEIYRDVSRSR